MRRALQYRTLLPPSALFGRFAKKLGDMEVELVEFLLFVPVVFTDEIALGIDEAKAIGVAHATDLAKEKRLRLPFARCS